MQVHLTLKSSNTKTGAIPVSTTEKDSCPDTCSFKKGGCYALDYHLNMHWTKVSEKSRGTNWQEFCDAIAGFKPNTLWRHNQAGDLPGQNNLIDAAKLDQLVAANKGKNGFTYTHYPINNSSNLVAIQSANAAGFTINISAENLADADNAYNLGLPSTVVLSSNPGTSTFKSPAGNTIAICPAQLKDNISCKTCQLCQKSSRKAIVGFIAHGSSKAKIIKILAVRG
jgi:hypothetical protein